MMIATIFGHGNTGTSSGEVFTSRGASVEHLDDPDVVDTVTGEIVVLAVPYFALGDIVAKHADQLAGKIVIDITNPRTSRPSTRSSYRLAARLSPSSPRRCPTRGRSRPSTPRSARRSLAPNQTTVLIAGDDVDTKETLSAAITAGGLPVIEAGTLSRAHELGAIGFAQLTLAQGKKIGWVGGFSIAS